MPLKIIDNFDSSFLLEPDAKTALFEMLHNQSFLSQVASEIADHKKSDRVEFTELLFQPVPYSTSTPKGMPAEFEKYHNSDNYFIINVPPNFMFKAKIFKPSRLCAIYKLKDEHNFESSC
ncbi:MAG: hypothetical protein AAF378_23400 [Cyanobacteria bacterium P01_A01_bin.84]